MTPMTIGPVVLQGSVVRLEPLSLSHFPAMAQVGLDEPIWKWNPNPVTTGEQMEKYIEKALAEQDAGVSLPFAIVHQASGQVIGCTRYGNIVCEHRRLEIGWTWLAVAHQRTGANTEAKLLLLTHAFETLGAYRVELKTDALNEQSRNAILRIGATQEGIFRNHMIIAGSGRRRDTVYFSILDSEWPTVKAKLLTYGPPS